MERSMEELLELIRLAERISADIHRLEGEREILQTVVGAFRASKRFNAHILIQDDDHDVLKFAATSFSPVIVKLGETIAGLSMDTVRIDLDETQLLARVFRGGETIRILTTEALEDFLPSTIVPAILRRLRYEGTEDILTPLHRDGQPAGILSVTAPGLAEHFIPSLKNLAHHIGTALDLAQALKERSVAERQYQDLIENLNEIFYSVDPAGHLTYISPNVAKMGFTPKELIGRSFGEIFAGAELEAIQSRFEQYLSGERRSGHADYRLTTKDGMLRWVRISSRTVIEDGRAVGITGSIADVTESKRAGASLAESERILNQTGRMAKIGGWEHDLETGQATWTDQLYEIIEIERTATPPGTDEHFNYYPPEDRARLEEAYNHATEDGVPFDLELQVRTATGRLLWCRAYGEPVIENGKCVKMRGTFQDINSRKLAELAKAESERQLSTLMSNLPGMVYRCKNDDEWSMEFVSKGCSNLTGYAPEDLIGSHVASYGALIHPEDKGRVWKNVQDAVEARRPFELEYRLLAADGSEKWVREQGQAVLSENEDVLALEGFISDVSEQHRAEEALRANEERLGLALEATSDGLWDWNTLTGETYFSPRCYTMLGYEPYEFPPEYDAWRSNIHPDDREGALRQLQEHIGERDDSFEIEFRIQARDSSWHWILNRGRVVRRDNEGQPARLIGTHVDITERRESAAALQRALDGTIRAVARMAEARDPYTAGHQERVALLSCAIAREMGHFALSHALRVAGLLHDIGKIAVPSEILSKPSRLTEPEMELVRGHAEASYRILEGIDFPWPIEEMVRQHHERLDGTGYPQRLQGDEICLGARILAVADVVEAIASHRPYRPALGIDSALAEIERARGSEFDPDAVDACLRLFRERELTLETLSEDVCASETQ